MNQDQERQEGKDDWGSTATPEEVRAALEKAGVKLPDPVDWSKERLTKEEMGYYETALDALMYGLPMTKEQYDWMVILFLKDNPDREWEDDTFENYQEGLAETAKKRARALPGQIRITANLVRASDDEIIGPLTVEEMDLLQREVFDLIWESHADTTDAMIGVADTISKNRGLPCGEIEGDMDEYYVINMQEETLPLLPQE